MRSRSNRIFGIVLLTVVMALALSAPLARAETNLDDWLNQLPQADAANARAIAEHLNGQWSVIARDQTARDVLEFETDALAKAQAAVSEQDAANGQAIEALAKAQLAADESEATLVSLKAMREIQTAYETADRAYKAAVTAEASAAAALAAAEVALTAAQDAAKEQAFELNTQMRQLSIADTRVKALRDEAAAAKAAAESGVSEESSETDGKALETLEADLADAENSLAIFSKQVDQYAERDALAKDSLKQAEAAHAKASDSENAAKANVEAKQTALTDAQAAFDGLKMGYDELVEADKNAQSNSIKVKAALDAAKARADQTAEQLNERSEEAAMAEARYNAAVTEHDEAAAALAELSAKWQVYSSCIDAVLSTYPMPAMDLLARAEATPALYGVYLNGTRLYLFKSDADGAEEMFLSTVLQESRVNVELTRTAKRVQSLRYVSVDGKTHNKPFGADASVLFTGIYPMLTIDSQLRGMTQFLGEASDVNTTSMHSLTTLVQFGLENPIRHEAGPQEPLK